ncbi:MULTISPECIES: hypothetical protein [unclassified Corynebacterium]|uniref:hypothetical protein n=1 Tax=unclassified Corynebacterium TaxID=2624378 RepID=UPI0029CA933B|nr:MULTISPECIES: hypothetical protein [unclassified Corynebacterium]WPF66827.1 hypothetical protein OLX12_03640 [Corynebacterium sp. 22KM0430]WPF69315.1 hypothetical protein OLW90_03635 [Corynebacterium sp. 21KM1197]
MRWFRRRSTPPLPRAPREVAEVRAAHLHVHTAESLVVLTTSPAALREAGEALTAGAAVRLSCGDGRPVTLFEGDTSPALDPDEGWLIPLPRQAREFVCGLPAEPGAWEVPGTNVGVVAE